MLFQRSTDWKQKQKKWKGWRILAVCQRKTGKAEKAVEHKGDSNTNWSWCVWNSLGKIQEKLEMKERIEIILITTLLRSARILRNVFNTWEDLLLLGPQWKTSSKRWWLCVEVIIARIFCLWTLFLHKYSKLLYILINCAQYRKKSTVRF